MKTFLISLILVFLTSPLVAQERHPIDQIAYNKLQSAFSNADMIEAEKEAYQHWDNLLNIVYQETKKQMQPATFAAVRESQRIWLNYREAEFKVIDRLYYAELQGTMWYAPAASARKRVVRQRTLSLLDQLGLLGLQQEEESPGIEGAWIGIQANNETTILEIRDDFTIVWSDQKTKRYKVEFYTMSNECADQKIPEGKRVISLIEPGNQSAKQCYYLKDANDQLNLSPLDGGPDSTFKRLR